MKIEQLLQQISRRGDFTLTCYHCQAEHCCSEGRVEAPPAPTTLLRAAALEAHLSRLLQTHLQQFQSTGRANSSLLLNKATSLSSNASYSAQYGKGKLGKIEYPKFGGQAAGLPISLSAQLIPYHMLAPSQKRALWYSKIFMSPTTSILEYCPSIPDTS